MNDDNEIPVRLDDESWLDEYEAYCASVAVLTDNESYVNRVLFAANT